MLASALPLPCVSLSFATQLSSAPKEACTRATAALGSEREAFSMMQCRQPCVSTGFELGTALGSEAVTRRRAQGFCSRGDAGSFTEARTRQ